MSMASGNSYLRSLKKNMAPQQGIPTGWRPRLTTSERGAKIQASFEHPQHGVVSVHKNPESGHFEVRHNGAFAGMRGNKGIYPDAQSAIRHARSYLGAVSQGTVTGKTMQNMPSASLETVPGAPGAQPGLKKDGMHPSPNPSPSPAPHGDPKAAPVSSEGWKKFQSGFNTALGKADKYLRSLKKSDTVSPQKNARALHQDLLDTAGGLVGGTVREGSMYGSVQNGGSDYVPGTEKFHYASLVFDIDAIRGAYGSSAENATVKCTPDWSKGINLNRTAAMKSKSDKPVIIATLPLDSGHKLLLIDGHHRMYKACRNNNATLSAHILSPEDTLKHVEGPPDLMANMWANVKKTAPVRKSEDLSKSIMSFEDIAKWAQQGAKRSVEQYLRGLSKADVDLGKPTPNQGYVEQYVKTARAQLERRLATNDDAINDIKTKFKGAEQKQRLAAHDRMLKYWKEAVKVGEQVLRGKQSSEPPPIKISEDNSKLKKDGIVSFNIPAGHACPGKGECFGPCYALVGPQSWPAAINVRTQNWAAAERPDFTHRMTEQLKKYPAGQRIRVHDSGDFYDQGYIDKWHAIAKAHPDKNFYAYTKALNLDWRKLAALPNFNIVQSVGGVHDRSIDPNMPHAFIFPSEDEMKRNGYIDTNASDLPASDKKNVKIGLVIHGSRAGQLDPTKFGQRFAGGVNITDPTLKPKEKPKEVKKSMGPARPVTTGFIPEEAKLDQPDHVHQAMAYAKKNPARKLKISHVLKLARLGQLT